MPLPHWDPVAGLERTRQWGAGRIFFVHAFNGDNDNNGISPNEPFETITHALTLCGDDRQDYIICMSTWAQEPAWPIRVPITNRAVHIIGPGRENGTLGAYLYPGGANEPTFLLESGAVEVEIAGSNMGGGDDHGCIELESTQRAWILHNHFGNSDQGLGTPSYGVSAPAGGSVHFMVCEDNVFWGDQVNVGQGISVNGFDIPWGSWMTIRRNRFMGCVIGIRLLSCGGCMLIDNLFACPDSEGAAITLVAHANSVGNMITGNVAMEGAETAIAANPFLDQNNNNLNHWGDNRCTLALGMVSLAHVPA